MLYSPTSTITESRRQNDSVFQVISLAVTLRNDPPPACVPGSLGKAPEYGIYRVENILQDTKGRAEKPGLAGVLTEREGNVRYHDRGDYISRFVTLNLLPCQTLQPHLSNQRQNSILNHPQHNHRCSPCQPFPIPHTL